jgi:hypothetical protein
MVMRPVKAASDNRMEPAMTTSKTIPVREGHTFFGVQNFNTERRLITLASRADWPPLGCQMI